jgi:hypothetical protein
VLLALGLGCAGQRAPGPVLPAGIAELQLPSSAASLARIAAEDEPAGLLDRRREILIGLNRQMLMSPPDEQFVPEVYDFVTVLAPRMEAGAVSPAWGSYLLTTYQRDLRTQRPDGRPRRSRGEIEEVMDGYVEFFRLRYDPRDPRPDASGAGFEDTRSWRDEQRLGR